jgi:membrane protein
VALLLGAEIDSELERGRQLQAGMPAERDLQLPPRDTRGIRKARKKEEKDIERGRLIREQAADASTDRDQDQDAVTAATDGPTDGRHRTTTTREKTS